jgi:hypothetical protein
MRHLPFLSLIFLACNASPPSTESVPLVQPDLGTRIELPFEPRAKQEVTDLGQLVSGVVRLTTKSDYAWASGYPTTIRFVQPEPATFIVPCAGGSYGSIRWHEVTAHEGQAAALRVVDGAMTLELKGPGMAAFSVRGELLQPSDGPGCEVDGVKPATLPLEHRLEVTVREISAVRLSWPYDRTRCSERVVLPSAAETFLPSPQLLDAAGEVFEARNAGRQVGVSILAPGGILMAELGERDRFAFRPGEVSLVLQSELPVTGPDRVTVVGPEHLTTFRSGFMRAQLNGDPVPVHSGETLDASQIFKSADPRVLQFRYELADAEGASLCVLPPVSWFHFGEVTPAVCQFYWPKWGDADLLQLLHASDDGLCEVHVTVPGATWSWDLEVTFTGVRP